MWIPRVTLGGLCVGKEERDAPMGLSREVRAIDASQDSRRTSSPAPPLPPFIIHLTICPTAPCFPLLFAKMFQWRDISPSPTFTAVQSFAKNSLPSLTILKSPAEYNPHTQFQPYSYTHANPELSLNTCSLPTTGTHKMTRTQEHPRCVHP